MGPLRAALIALAAAAGGCAHTSTLVVRAAPHANHDRQFYLVVRTLQESEFVTDAYERIAALVFPTKPDPSVRLVRLVAPGKVDKVKLPLPVDQPFAVYALFTDPGAEWKALLTPPLAGRYEIDVDGNRVSVRGPASRRRAAPALQAPSLATPSLAAPQAPSLPDTAVSAPELGR